MAGSDRESGLNLEWEEEKKKKKERRGRRGRRGAVISDGN